MSEYEEGVTIDRRVTLNEVKVATLSEQTKYIERIMNEVKTSNSDGMKDVKNELKDVKSEVTNVKQMIFKLAVIGTVAWAIVLPILMYFHDPILKSFGFS